jgi:hypothetical protein
MSCQTKEYEIFDDDFRFLHPDPDPRSGILGDLLSLPGFVGIPTNPGIDSKSPYFRASYLLANKIVLGANLLGRKCIFYHSVTALFKL